MHSNTAGAIIALATAFAAATPAMAQNSAADIIATDAFTIYEKLGLAAHLTPQRSNGVRSMIERIKTDARAAAAG